MSQTFNPSLLTPGIRALLIKTMATAAGAGKYLNEIATYLSSDKRTEHIPWIGPAPRMRLLGDDREIVFDGMSDADYSLSAQTWAAGIVVKKEDIEDDQLGAIKMRIQQLATVAAYNPDRLLLQALVDGTTNTGYDGVAFFSDSHTARGQQSAAQDNNMAASGQSTSQIVTDLGDAIETMMSFVDENGEPFHAGDLTKLTIVAPPSLRRQFMEALNATIISNTSNVQVDGVQTKLMLSARLTGNAWYLLHTGGPVKPLVWLDRVAVKLDAQEDDSDSGFEREQWRYKVRARQAPGYLNWQNAIRVA